VAVAWVAVKQVTRLTDFFTQEILPDSSIIRRAMGLKPDVNFVPNDTLYVRLKAKGRFRRTRAREYGFWKGIIVRLTESLFIPKLPYTRYQVAEQRGDASYKWNQCATSDPEFFCDEVLIKINLEFPEGLGSTPRRKLALLKIARKRALEAYGSQSKAIKLGLKSLGGIPDFEEGAEESLIVDNPVQPDDGTRTVGELEARFKPVPVERLF
jgi:hypothetical protein